MIFYKEAKGIQGEKIVSSINGAETTGYQMQKKKKSRYRPYIIHKKFTIAHRPKLKCQTIKPLEDNIGEIIDELGSLERS